ncbi:MAG: HIT family protein [Culturomica sp.]|jgi:histidine triad (HIT) family protein|nr:HIT family protein [Culturomica sp.]
MPSVFTKIINGEIPSYKVAEDANYYAFLDISPLQKAHTLVVPKKETDYIFDLTDDELAGMVLFAKKVARAIEKTVDCKKVGMAVIGLEVPHAHIHLVPLIEEHDLNFNNPRKTFSSEEMKYISASIASNLE